MAKRRVKKRPQAHIAARMASSTKPGERIPKSMVIRIGAGEVGPSVSQLVKDVREVMEPHTASRLKERRSNRLRDYTTMAGPLGITHLMLFSRSENGNTNLRLAITPRGPTLHFRVTNYSLCKDIVKSLKRAKSIGVEHHTTSPLLVMNNFMSKDSTSNSAVPKHLEQLTTSVFQSLFAPINPTATPLRSIKRILLMDRAAPEPDSDDPPYVLNFRHYSISTPIARSSQPRALRKLNAAATTTKARKTLPNLGRLGDMSEYLLDPNAAAGFTSASETELDTDAEVEVLAPTARRAPTKEERQAARDLRRARIEQKAEADSSDDEAAAANPLPASEDRVEKRAIKLTELGPRMTLRLTKVEEGLCGGKVMWHEYIHKTAAEMAALERTWAERTRVRDERRRVQRENVERKRKEKMANGEDGELAAEEMAEIMGDDKDDFWDDEDEGADEDEDEEMEDEE